MYLWCYTDDIINNNNNQNGDDEDYSKKLQLLIESEKFNDLIQQDFTDTYYNNTLKTCMAIKWINNYCSNSKYYLLIDDDFYLSK